MSRCVDKVNSTNQLGNQRKCSVVIGGMAASTALPIITKFTSFYVLHFRFLAIIGTQINNAYQMYVQPSLDTMTRK